MVFRTQSPSNIKDLLVSQDRGTMESIKGRRQNWKPEANLLHVEERRGRTDEARLKGVGTGTSESRAGEQHCKRGATEFLAAPRMSHPVPSHFIWPGGAWSGPYRCVLRARERSPHRHGIYNWSRTCVLGFLGSSYSRQHKQLSGWNNKKISSKLKPSKI